MSQLLFLKVRERSLPEITLKAGNSSRGDSESKYKRQRTHK